MKKGSASLKNSLLTTIVLCWLVPIFIIVAFASVLLEGSYRRSINQEVDASVKNGLRQVQMHLEDVIGDSKAVSYDGVIRNVYRSFQSGKDRAALFRSTNDYLTQNFAREEKYKAVSIHFWGQDISAYQLSSGTAGYDLLQQCRRNAPAVLEEMVDADTDIRFLMLDGQLYMARNLLDSTFKPYATVIIMLDAQTIFQPLASINRTEDVRLRIDDLNFVLTDTGVTTPEPEPEEPLDMQRGVTVDDYVFSFAARTVKYDFWKENSWLVWGICGVALMVLPLMAVVVTMFYSNVTRPMEILAEAHLLVQSGMRGYEIHQQPPNAEFGKLYHHFNAMSTELKNQFERSYLEQQATQKAQIKALQSQINPHFLNNTLEIINWEARLADNTRVCGMLDALSTMLDAALDRDGRTQISLKEELGYVDAYLYIIRQRQGEGFRVEQQIEPDILEQMIPRLILQPIVENAVEHDISARHDGRLCLRAYRQDSRMVLEVEHDGTMTEKDRENIRALLSPGSQQRGQVGLKNVYQRLKLLYGEEGSLTVDEVSPGSILARISFPCFKSSLPSPVKEGMS